MAAVHHGGYSRRQKTQSHMQAGLFKAIPRMQQNGNPFESPGTQFFTILSELEGVLEKTRAWLLANAPEKYSYRFVSHHELRETDKTMGAWLSSGQIDRPPQLDRYAERAVIYRIGLPGSDIQAYRAVCALAVVELIETALPKLRQKKLSIAFAMLRGLIERTAAVNALIEKVTPILGQPHSTNQQAYGHVIEASEAIRIALHGTKVNWSLLASRQFETLPAKSAVYEPLEYEMDVAAKSILNAVDSLNKRIPGTRVSYDILCEFLHPNVGDMLAATISAKPLTDRFGTRHIEFIIGRGPADLSSRPEIGRVFAESLRVVSNIVTQFPDIYRELTKLCDVISLRTRKAIRLLLKQSKDLFSKHDLCPCHSGKTVGACCLALRLR